jgi:hypothetical protein
MWDKLYYSSSVSTKVARQLYCRRVGRSTSSSSYSYYNTNTGTAFVSTVAAIGFTAAAVATSVSEYLDFVHTSSLSSSSSFLSNDNKTYCDDAEINNNDTSTTKTPASKAKMARLFRKRTTLRVAITTDTSTQSYNNKDDSSSSSSSSTTTTTTTTTPKTPLLQRFSTQEELNKLRVKEKEMMERWEKDEEGWRELPARAWPPYQPNPEQLQGILAEIVINGCDVFMIPDGDGVSTTFSDKQEEKEDEDEDNDGTNKMCTDLLFDMATSFVFYNVNPSAGLRHYEKLANRGHVDSMVACGIILCEGLGVPPREKEGLEWLQKAVALGSTQGCYELGTLYYIGIDGVLEEDPKKAFELFERAAAEDHTAALYMVADCLVEGEGTEKNVARAVPLFYKAAERGHRFSRQRIRELLARLDYPL